MLANKLIVRLPQSVAVFGRRTLAASSEFSRPSTAADESKTEQPNHFPAVASASLPRSVDSRAEASGVLQLAGLVPAGLPPADQPPSDLQSRLSSSWKILQRDLSGIKLLVTLKWKMRQAFRRNEPIHTQFLHWVRVQPTKVCVIEVDTGRSFTFRQINSLANKYANFFHQKGFRRGDVIALFMENSADFFALWLGLSKLGVISAWINTNLKLEPLAHSVNTAHATTIVTTPQLLSTLRTTISEGLLPRDTQVFSVGKSDVFGEIPDVRAWIYDESEPPIPFGHTFESILCYIYTSGTTGNPKAAVIKQFRYMFMTLASGQAFGIRRDDRIYITMPMYHSAAGIIGIGQTIVHGSTAVIRRNFSANEFWSDAIKHDASVSQYIGELCRYLLAQKKKDEERKHRIRLMYGNGLRQEIWEEFVERFGIKKIGEVNIDNHVGSCGFIPTFPGIKNLYPMRLLKVNPETNELIRDANGLCIQCEPGDTGEVVGMIKNDAQTSFEGYLDQAETEKKVIRNVFQTGDAVFASGDILYWSKEGYLFFKDRCGDTYRWRGENVSTMEVEGVLQPVMSIQDATVFGVEVQGREGRAGMIGATLVEGADMDKTLAELSERLPEHLPAYAVPLFVRFCKQVERTGTFKLKKADLQKQGFDPAACNGDPLFYWNAEERRYLPLDTQMFVDIQTGAYSRI
ncbi:Fatty Acid CoA Synthetase family [Aphelenchoides fujianensis]|nr:Fatty Acid CoA Synthetase family [Aphelenchoides fujianensis]